jgi:hypothetical protein
MIRLSGPIACMVARSVLRVATIECDDTVRAGLPTAHARVTTLIAGFFQDAW